MDGCSKSHQTDWQNFIWMLIRLENKLIENLQLDIVPMFGLLGEGKNKPLEKEAVHS